MAKLASDINKIAEKVINCYNGMKDVSEASLILMGKISNQAEKENCIKIQNDSINDLKEIKTGMFEILANSENVRFLETVQLPQINENFDALEKCMEYFDEFTKMVEEGVNGYFELKELLNKKSNKSFKESTDLNLEQLFNRDLKSSVSVEESAGSPINKNFSETYLSFQTECTSSLPKEQVPNIPSSMDSSPVDLKDMSSTFN